MIYSIKQCALALFAIVAMVSANLVPPVCSPCPRQPNTLPVLPYIPGDNTCSGVTQTQALQALYYQLGGSGWFNKANWLVGDPCANNWYGITCNQNGDVINIDLHSNNLVGNQIPPAIGCLPFLKGLVLDNNHIFGQLPNNLCKLTNIQYLTLGHNNLGGTIPTCFSQLIYLQELYLEDNGLTGVLPNISGYLTLRELVVNDNCLSGEVPQNIVNAALIVDLIFSNNNFQGCIPDFPYQTPSTHSNFSGNPSYCYSPIPCWLTDAQIGCVGVPPRHNVGGPFPGCNAACLSVF